MDEHTTEQAKYLQSLIELWEEHGNTAEELLIDDLEPEVQIETVEHMLKMAGIDYEAALKR